MLSRMVAAGFQFEIAGDVLQVRPADKLTDEQRSYIQEHKPELMDEVRELAPVNRWLDSIGENDALVRASVIERCKSDSKSKAYFLSRAAELDLPDDAGNVIPISRAMSLADCSTCRHQIRSSINPKGGLSHCEIRLVDMKLPHCKRECDKHEPL